MQRVDVFDLVLANEEQNEYTLFYNILRTVSLLIPVISSNIRTLSLIFGQTLLNDFCQFFCSEN
jgi:hypothetical protein